ncbi:MAG TPA: hypothetical protein VF395_22875 [Polyangiaceae bacterium]
MLVVRGLMRAALGAGAVLAVACASPQSQGGKGSECYRVEDCQEGLVCVKNVCTSDLKSIAGKAPVGSAGGVAGAAAAKEAGAPAEGGTARGGASAAGGSSAVGGTTSPGGAPGAGGAATAGGTGTGGVTGTGGASSATDAG